MSWLLIKAVGFYLTLGSPCIWKAAIIFEKNHSKTPLFRPSQGIRAIGGIQAFSGMCMECIHLYTAHPELTASVQILIPSEEQEPGSLWLCREDAYGLKEFGKLGAWVPAFSHLERRQPREFYPVAQRPGHHLSLVCRNRHREQRVTDSHG